MGKKVKIDEKNRVIITILRDVGVFREEDDEAEIAPNSVTGLMHPTIKSADDIDMIIESLESHKRHYELEKKKWIKNNNEEDEEGG